MHRSVFGSIVSLCGMAAFMFGTTVASDFAGALRVGLLVAAIVATGLVVWKKNDIL